MKMYLSVHLNENSAFIQVSPNNKYKLMEHGWWNMEHKTSYRFDSSVMKNRINSESKWNQTNQLENFIVLTVHSYRFWLLFADVRSQKPISTL